MIQILASQIDLFTKSAGPYDYDRAPPGSGGSVDSGPEWDPLSMPSEEEPFETDFSDEDIEDVELYGPGKAKSNSTITDEIHRWERALANVERQISAGKSLYHPEAIHEAESEIAKLKLKVEGAINSWAKVPKLPSGKDYTPGGESARTTISNAILAIDKLLEYLDSRSRDFESQYEGEIIGLFELAKSKLAGVLGACEQCDTSYNALHPAPNCRNCGAPIPEHGEIDPSDPNIDKIQEVYLKRLAVLQAKALSVRPITLEAVNDFRTGTKRMRRQFSRDLAALRNKYKKQKSDAYSKRQREKQTQQERFEKRLRDKDAKHARDQAKALIQSRKTTTKIAIITALITLAASSAWYKRELIKRVSRKTYAKIRLGIETLKRRGWVPGTKLSPAHVGYLIQLSHGIDPIDAKKILQTGKRALK